MSIIDELSQSLAEFYAIVEGGVQELLTEKPQEYHHEGFVDGDVTEEEWETYREYLQNIKEGFEDFKTHTYEKPHVKGVHLKTLAINALVSANKKRENKGMLRDLWQRNGLNYPIGAYADFDDSPSLEHYWRQYIKTISSIFV